MINQFKYRIPLTEEDGEYLKEISEEIREKYGISSISQEQVIEHIVRVYINEKTERQSK